MNDEIVLCAASSYEQKFYLNPEFDALPEAIKQELQIMCVLYTEDVGGVLLLVFDEDGNLELKVDHEEGDFAFDEIGSVLKIKELQQKKRELFESLELFFKVFYFPHATLSLLKISEWHIVLHIHLFFKTAIYFSSILRSVFG